MQRHPVDQIRQLAETASRSGPEAAIMQNHSIQITLPAGRLADTPPIGESLAGTDDESVKLGNSQAQIRYFIILQLHIDITQAPKQRCGMAGRLIRQSFRAKFLGEPAPCCDPFPISFPDKKRLPANNLSLERRMGFIAVITGFIGRLLPVPSAAQQFRSQAHHYAASRFLHL